MNTTLRLLFLSANPAYSCVPIPNADNSNGIALTGPCCCTIQTAEQHMCFYTRK